MPDRKKLDRYIDGIYERQWLTNNGPLVQELTRRLEDYLKVDNLLLVANGTLALQIAYRALDVGQPEDGSRPEAVTTPFSFVATASSLRWEGIAPVFADIDSASWCLNPSNIESVLTPATRAIVPVHVFGNACQVEQIDEMAGARDLKVIYDASHAFAVDYRGGSLLSHGDASTLSFHATKLFHTGEGGAIVFRRKEDLERARMLINFGITGPDTVEALGINAKMSEMQAAIGLCVLDDMELNISARERVWRRYEASGKGVGQKRTPGCGNNYGYYPVLFQDTASLERAVERLGKSGVLARRYFKPSLDLVPSLLGRNTAPVSRNIASRILCLPIYASLDDSSVDTIIHCLDEFECFPVS